MLTRDVVQSLRWLRSHPLFAISVIAILALGVGANTAVFSVVDAVLLRALPYESSPGLVRIQAASAKRQNMSISAGDYLSFGDRSSVFAKTVPYFRDVVTLTGIDQPDQFFALRAPGALFSMLAVHARLGRALSDADDQPGAANTAVLSDRLWQRDFHSDPGVIGRAVTVSGAPFTVVGVMRPEFDFPAPEIQMWTSVHLSAATPGVVLLAGRLKPGISPAQAQASLEPIARRLEQKEPIQKAGLKFEVSRWSDNTPRENRLTLLFILCAVGLVLLIACADVGGLLLSRAVERQREIAIRASLGAGLWQVVRQLLIEAVTLAAIGSALGIAAARVALRFLTSELAALPANLPHIQRISLNGRVLAFNLALCLAIAALSSLAPVLFALRTDLQTALRSGQTSAPRGSAKMFSVLIAAQAAFAFLLLAGSGLMLHSLIRLEQTDRGFHPEHVLTLRVPVGGSFANSGPGKYDTRPQQIAYYREILERVERIPGVIAAAYTNNLPLSGATTSLATIKGGSTVFGRTVSPKYFTAMGIPLTKGRFFEDADKDRHVAIMNQSMAREQFPGRDPIGQTMQGGAVVVGVVKDATQTFYDQPVKDELYLPYQQYIFGAFLSTFVIRTSGDPLALADALRKEIWAVDPDQPVLKIETMEDIVADSIWRPRFSAWVFSVLGGLALLLTCAGVYSVIAYTATLRTREVGIRVALGASPRRIVGLILRDAVMPLAAGLVASMIAAALLGRLVSGLLWETSPADPAAYLGAAAALMVTGALASARPAVRSARADPARALRSE